MKRNDVTLTMLIGSALSLVGWPAQNAWAQGTSTGAAPSGAATTVIVAALVVAVLVVLGALIKMIDLKRKREGESIIVQARISDALLRDPRLFSLPITPTAHVPLWKGSPVTVELAGQVPSEELREAAIRLADREASAIGTEVQMESRIGVVPTMARRSA